MTVRNWASDLDEGTRVQAERLGRHPQIAGPVALMPDAHVGIGATIGSVIVTDGALIPSAVGVDIGCGMIAVQTDLSASQLPDSMDLMVHRLTRAIPAGVGRGHARGTRAASDWLLAHPLPDRDYDRDQRKKYERDSHAQLGSLGSGNHFAEVCLDENDSVWAVLHSGSRGIGNKLAMRHIGLAKKQHQALEDPDLAYFLEGTTEFETYVEDVLWAQAYALENRELMMDAMLAELWKHVGSGQEIERINCHHNYTEQERHMDRELWVTRKGAIRAQLGDKGVIPGSMGTRSYIVEGLGNAESYNSSSHGAGRRMSRTQARKTISVDDLTAAMGDRAWQSDEARKLVDEAPMAYKDIDQVMADQKDLTRIVHTLRQIVNYKGTN